MAFQSFGWSRSVYWQGARVYSQSIRFDFRSDFDFCRSFCRRRLCRGGDYFGGFRRVKFSPSPKTKSTKNFQKLLINCFFLRFSENGNAWKQALLIKLIHHGNKEINMGSYCKKCGQEYNSLQSLVTSYCSNGGKHEPYTGHESGPYHCKKCGQEYNSLQSLVTSYCSNGGKHEPLE